MVASVTSNFLSINLVVASEVANVSFSLAQNSFFGEMSFSLSFRLSSSVRVSDIVNNLSHYIILENYHLNRMQFDLSDIIRRNLRDLSSSESELLI